MMILDSRSPAAAAVLCIALVASAIAAQEAAPEMSAEEAAMMAAWQNVMTPGEPHAHLAKAAGTWDMTMKAWTEGPGAEPSVSRGTSENTMILDGRVLRQTVNSEVMGMPFEGLGLNGYDNATGKYWTIWMDNMSTGVYLSRGTHDEATGETTLHGEYVDPLGESVKVRAVVRQESDDESVFEWHETRGDQEMMTMEITYTRRAE